MSTLIYGYLAIGFTQFLWVYLEFEHSFMKPGVIELIIFLLFGPIFLLHSIFDRFSS